MLDTATRQRLEARVLNAKDNAIRVPDPTTARVLDFQAQQVLDYLNTSAADANAAAEWVGQLEQRIAQALLVFGLAPTVAVAVAGPAPKKPRPSGAAPPTVVSYDTTPAAPGTPAGGAPAGGALTRARAKWAAMTTSDRSATAAVIAVGVGGLAWWWLRRRKKR